MRHPRLVSIRNRLTLLFFLITVGAVSIVYFYVVPQLESNLTAEKVSSLEADTVRIMRPLEVAAARGKPTRRLAAVTRRVADRAGARLTLLGIERRGGDQGLYVLADSQSVRGALRVRYDVARDALDGSVTTATESAPSGRIAQVARPVRYAGRVAWVAVFSTSLADVADNVGLIRRQILVAGAIALFLALLAGIYAAQAIARRVKRLEAAAMDVAAGRFSQAIPDDSSDELGQLSRAFNEMQRKLDRLDSARKEFIANASHELRTPIFSLGGFVELLQDEELDQETREEFLRTMREQVDRLQKLATDLLDLSRLDAGTVELRPEPTELGDLARSVASEFTPAAGQHASSIEVQPANGTDVEVVCDPERVAQIMRILLDNALTHTPAGTCITVRATRPQGDGQAVLVVGDDGPGIPGASVGQVFDRFHSGDAGRGSGLGLAIARELADRMSGRLEVRSEAGSTEFALTLPAAGPSAAGNGR